MIGRFRILGVLVAVLSLLVAPQIAAEAEPVDGAADEAAEQERQEEAAAGVMAELASAPGPMTMAEIAGLDEMGPPPWLSFTGERSPEVLAAWDAVVDQLPTAEMAGPRPPGDRPPIDFAESEDPDETGRNDTVATGERIADFGTRRGESRVVTIDGHLSGADVRLPIDFDCPSVEDDGAIPLANPPAPNVSAGALCGGEIGDGPHGATTGDVDFYDFGDVDAGALLVLDVVNVSSSFDPVDAVIAIYDEAGNLLAQAEDRGAVPEDPEFLLYEVTTPGRYYGAVIGCCDLPADPFDPASGPGVGATGTYEVVVVAVPPPCLSIEDDGAIPLANDVEPLGQGDDQLFVTECFGDIGDGPQAATGDVDFFQTREIQAGQALIVDLFDVDPGSVAGDFTIGVYDAAGNLLASGQDDPSPGDSDFFTYEVATTGTYYVALAGGLPTDPFDPTTGTDTDLTGFYDVFIVDVDPDLLAPPDAASAIEAARAASAADREAAAFALLTERRADAMAAAAEAPAVDTDVYLVRLRRGDAIAGGFDDARFVSIIDPDGVDRMTSTINPSFIYPVGSPLAHGRQIGFDHVATRNGWHAVVVTEGLGAYQGELRVTRSGLADDRSDDQQVIYVDFDGAAVSPGIFFGEPAGPEVDLSPMSRFLAAWGLGPADEDELIDAVLDAMLENLDADLRVHDGRNGDRDRTGLGRQFDLEILNSRDHGDRWGEDNVSRIIIGGTIDELQIPTIGIAQSIDPGNQATEETGVVLLDELSGPPGGPISLNTYPVAGDRTRIDLIGWAVGHIAAHEVGHFIGNWHTETFNDRVSLMDAGGEFESVFGVGADGVFGTADDIDADFAEDIYNVFEGFIGTEDTAGRSVYALSTGRRTPQVQPTTAILTGTVTEPDGSGARGVVTQLYAAEADGSRGSYLGAVLADRSGTWVFDLDPGCYVVVVNAPRGRTFPGGEPAVETGLCLVPRGERSIDLVLE